MLPQQVVAASMKVATDRVESGFGLESNASFIVFVTGLQVLSTVVHHLAKSMKYAVSLVENMAAILDQVPHALLPETLTTSLLMGVHLTSRARATIHWQLSVTILWGCHIFKSLHEMKHGMDCRCRSLLRFMSVFQDTWCMFHATCMAQLR